MKKLLFISFLFLVVGCSPIIKDTENKSMTNSTTNEDTTNLLVQSETEMVTHTSDDVNKVNIAQIFDFLDNDVHITQIEKRQVIFDEVLGDQLAFGITSLYNQETLIGYAYVDGPDSIDESIGLFHLQTNEYEPLLVFNEEMQAGIYCYNSEIVVYKAYYPDESVKLNVLQMGNGTNSTIFDYYLHPDSNKPVFDNFNDIAILDQTIYFDDFEKDDKNNSIIPILYAYDLSTGELIKLGENLQNPFIYKGEIIAFGKNSDGHFKTLYNVANDYALLEVTDDLRDIIVVNDRIYAIVNSDTNHEELYTVFQLKELISNQEILSTKSPIYNLKASQGHILWDTYYDSEFVYYDSSTDEIIICDNTVSSQNVTFTDGSNNLLMCLTEDHAPKYYTFSLKLDSEMN